MTSSASDRSSATPSPTNASATPTVGGSTGAGGATRPSWIGKRVGRFRLAELLGRGSMGSVFRAEDANLRRQVALKVIVDKSDPRRRPSDHVELFIQEARSAASLDHPNIVQIYEVNRAGEVYYIAMELIEGGNLESLVKAGGPMEISRACHLAAEAADALNYAHSCGIIHRDVKPGNLMLGRGGRCKLADFGLARRSNTDATTAGPVGTPLYAAPEVIRHEPATPLSDIYSLGATVYHLLAGRPPYVGAAIRDVLQMHLDSPVPDVREYRQDVPEVLALAISRAMSKDPGDRFATAQQFGSVLRIHTIDPAASTARLSSSNLSFEATDALPALAAAAQARTKRRKTRSGAPWLWVAASAVVIAGVAFGAIKLLKPSEPPVASTPRPEVRREQPKSAAPDHPENQATAAAAVTPAKPAPNTKPAVPIRPRPLTKPAPAPASPAPAAPTVPPPAPTTAPVPTPAPADPPAAPTAAIPLNDTATFLKIANGDDPRSGKPVLVEGTVRRIGSTATKSVFFIDLSDAPRDGLQIVFFKKELPAMKAAFPGSDDDLPNLLKQPIRVTGTVGVYNGRPQIKVEMPTQVEVIKPAGE